MYTYARCPPYFCWWFAILGLLMIISIPWTHFDLKCILTTITDAQMSGTLFDDMHAYIPLSKPTTSHTHNASSTELKWWPVTGPFNRILTSHAAGSSPFSKADTDRMVSLVVDWDDFVEFTVEFTRIRC
jgi:hypothetical protein